MASGYIIAYVDVTQPTQYELYRKWSSMAIEKHGAEVCVRDASAQALEGNWAPEHVMVLKFATIEQARAFYDSTEYRKARMVRQGAAEMRMICVEGV